MKKKMVMAIGIILVLLMVFTGSAWADSHAVIGTGPAEVDLNFTVEIPGFIYFQVGGDAPSAGDTVLFEPTSQQIADGTDTAASAGSGDVAVVLRGNVGSITIELATDGTEGLTSGGDHISYAQISTVSSGVGDTITPPVLTDASTTTSPIGANADGVIDLVGQWTYTYTNPSPPPASGTYSGHVVYTAVTP